jgi:DNA-binding transcriptional ArsR family regulator
VGRNPRTQLRAVHRALADPLRIQLLELLSEEARSAKELAQVVGMPADRLYHHLSQLEEGHFIEISEYRKLPGGKVERIYAPTPIEPPADDASPADVARFLGAVLEATRADINAASLAQEAGRQREIALGRTVVRLNKEHFADLKSRIEHLVRAAQEDPDPDGVWTTVVWALVEREDRRTTTERLATPRRASAGGSKAMP